MLPTANDGRSEDGPANTSHPALGNKGVLLGGGDMTGDQDRIPFFMVPSLDPMPTFPVGLLNPGVEGRLTFGTTIEMSVICPDG